MKPLQDLYVVFREDADPDSNVFMTVLEQFERGNFRVYYTSDLFNVQLPNGIQPFFFDLDGDMR